jgi:hypothetical protein
LNAGTSPFILAIWAADLEQVIPTKAAIRNLGGEKKFLLFTDSFLSTRNRVLTEDNPTTEFFVEQDEAHLDSSLYVCVHDATGRKYKKYMHKFPTL